MAFENTKYGRFPELIIEPDAFRPNREFFKNAKKQFDLAFIASKNLKTILEHKEEDKTSIELAKRKIRKAKNIFILGYGFDPVNSGIIGLEKCHENAHHSNLKNLYFTNFKDFNRVNKAAGRLFSVDTNAFINRPSYESVNGILYEKSNRNVYDALAHDFD